LYIYNTMSGERGAVATAIAAWSPTVFDPAVADVARRLVAAAAPVSATRARTLLWCCARLASWAETVGVELAPEVLLHPSTIERFVGCGVAAMPSSRRRSVRTNLRFVARRVTPKLWPPEPLALSRSRAKAPYTDAEIEGLLALADAQPTPARRHRLVALVCLGAGAGLCGADLRCVRGDHIQARGDALVVVVAAGPAPRVVPVLGRYRQRLAVAAAFAGDRFVCGGELPSRRNVTGNLVGSICGGADLPPICLRRLRASWLATHARALGLPALFAAAGIVCSQHLGDVIAQLPTAGEAEVLALLGGIP
jgi:integrase